MKCREIIEILDGLAPEAFAATGIIRDCWQEAGKKRLRRSF